MPSGKLQLIKKYYESNDSSWTYNLYVKHGTFIICSIPATYTDKSKVWISFLDNIMECITRTVPSLNIAIDYSKVF